MSYPLTQADEVSRVLDEFDYGGDDDYFHDYVRAAENGEFDHEENDHETLMATVAHASGNDSASTMDVIAEGWS